MKNFDREIAIITDIHALYEPLEAVLKHIKNSGVKDIYSLGDNIGEGPNPKEVIELLEENNVLSVAGNSEDYITIGTDSFMYIDDYREKSIEWTRNKLGEHFIKKLKLYPHSREIFHNNIKIGLCHFLSDVRIDYVNNSVSKYIDAVKSGKDAYKQFLYLNSKEQKRDVKKQLEKYGNCLINSGYKSVYKEPLFNGKTFDEYDYIFQGHSHFKLEELNYKTKIYTVKSLIFNCLNDDASYTLVKFTKDKINVEEKMVPFDREKMINSIEKNDNEYSKVKLYI